MIRRSAGTFPLGARGPPLETLSTFLIWRSTWRIHGRPISGAARSVLILICRSRTAASRAFNQARSIKRGRRIVDRTQSRGSGVRQGASVGRTERNASRRNGRIMPTSHATFLAPAYLASAVLFGPLGVAAAPSTPVVQVSALEDNYWEYVQRGDVGRYLALWHTDFIGWPCAFAAPHPNRKSGIGGWVAQSRDERIRSAALAHELLDALIVIKQCAKNIR